MGKEHTLQHCLVSHVSESSCDWIPQLQSDPKRLLATCQRDIYQPRESQEVKYSYDYKIQCLCHIQVWILERQNIYSGLSVAEWGLNKNVLNFSTGPFHYALLGIFL